MASRKQLIVTMQKLHKINIETISAEHRTKCLASIDRRYEQLKENANDLLDKSNRKLDNGDPDAISDCRKQSLRINNEIKELDELKKRVEEASERSLIKERMTRIVGGAKHYFAFQFIISILIMLVLFLLVYDMVAGPDDQRPPILQSSSIFWIDAFCCVIFLVEFFMRLKCATSKSFVWRHHWIDFVTSIPIPGAAQLARFGRFARLARFLRFARMLRFLRLFFLLWRGMDKFQDLFDIKLMKKTVKWAVMWTIGGAVLVYYFEGLPGSNGQFGEQVSDIPLAIWWSFTTVLTGGFGDIHNPVTLPGQILTGILVVMGMILVGVFTATLTTIFVGEQAEEIEKLSIDLGQRIDLLAESLEDIKNRDDV